MKRIKINNILCIFLILSLLISTASAAIPSENPIHPRFVRIAHLSSSCSISSSGYADCYGQVDLNRTSDTAELIMELQRSSNGYDWDTIKSWTASGKCAVELSKGWYVASGYSYRVHITVRVYTSSGSLVETATEDSFTAKY